MITTALLTKCQKLAAFIDRDCGNESMNAIRLLYMVIKDNNITDKDFCFKLHPNNDKDEVHTLLQQIRSYYFINHTTTKNNNNSKVVNDLYEKIKKDMYRKCYGAKPKHENETGNYHWVVIKISIDSRWIVDMVCKRYGVRLSVVHGVRKMYVNPEERKKVMAAINIVNVRWRKEIEEIKNMSQYWFD